MVGPGTTGKLADGKFESLGMVGIALRFERDFSCMKMKRKILYAFNSTPILPPLEAGAE